MGHLQLDYWAVYGSDLFIYLFILSPLNDNKMTTASALVGITLAGNPRFTWEHALYL